MTTARRTRLRSFTARRASLLLAALLPTLALHSSEPSWPQFHGPRGRGLAPDRDPLPTAIGPESHVLWKTPVPAGRSSPVIYSDRIFLTGEENGRLFTFALERTTGLLLWRREAPHEGLEQGSSHAQSSAATDGERVVSFFGSCGLFCYDLDGQELWRVPMGPFKNDFGAASSPVIVDDRVVLNQDHDEGSFLATYDKSTGKTIWKVDRSEFPRGFSTPTIWDVQGEKQIVVAGTLRAVGYDLLEGKEIWTVRGLARIANPTPVVGSDGILYIAVWSPGADPGDRIHAAAFDEQLRQHDANRNDLLEYDELPDTPVKIRFPQIDLDKSGGLTREEYQKMARIFHTAQNGVFAVRPGGRGDITETHVAWVQRRMLPYVASPLFHDGFLYLVKDGGIVSSLDTRTGKAVKQARLEGRSHYYSSPVYGDGKIYFLSLAGQLTVTTAEPDWKVLAYAEFKEPVFATPALLGGHIYLRTQGHVYAFSNAKDN